MITNYALSILWHIHPSSYEQCVSCGQAFYQEQEIEPADQNIETAPQSANQALDEGAVLAYPKSQKKDTISIAMALAGEFDQAPPVSKRRSANMKHMLKSGAPQAAGAITAIAILLISAGATFYFLTKAPESDRLLVKGLKELENGQFAFAVDTLNKATETSKDNPKVQLALASLYR